MTLLEAVGTAFGLASVWLTVKRHIACWPTGIVMVTLYGIVFYQARLYGNAALQGLYLVLSVYGWYHWLRGGDRQGDVPITRLTNAQFAAVAWAAVTAAAILGYWMKRRLDGDNPYLDSTVTALSIAAQWLLSRKNLSNWSFWIAVDALAIVLFGAQRLWLTAGLYAVLLFMAAAGLVEWRRAWRAQTSGAGMNA